MKPAQLESLSADLPPLEEDLAARLDVIFDRCPQLHGFTVQDSSALPEELRSLALEKELPRVAVERELGEAVDHDPPCRQRGSGRRHGR